MGYIGNEAQTAFTSFDKQTITGTGTAVYTLSHNVANEQEIEVFVNNVRQEGGSGKAYTVSGNQITFSKTLPVPIRFTSTLPEKQFRRLVIHLTNLCKQPQVRLLLM